MAQAGRKDTPWRIGDDLILGNADTAFHRQVRIYIFFAIAIVLVVGASDWD